MTHKRLFLLGVILLSACQGARVTPVPSTPDVHATITTEMKNNAQIKPSDNGKRFTYHLTDRFSVYLDDTNYPVQELVCTPDGIIGYVSNGSLGGLGHYPVMFEAVAEGQCSLDDRDFHVDILVIPSGTSIGVYP
jgi:hypothetical protein